MRQSQSLKAAIRSRENQLEDKEMLSQMGNLCLESQWFKRLLFIWEKNPTAAQTPPNKNGQAIALNTRGVLCLNMGEFKLAV